MGLSPQTVIVVVHVLSVSGSPTSISVCGMGAAWGLVMCTHNHSSSLLLPALSCRHRMADKPYQSEPLVHVSPENLLSQADILGLSFSKV